MTLIPGSKVLITGAAHGIGKLLVEKMLISGARHVVMWDVNKKGMQQIIDDFPEYADCLHAYEVDVRNLEEIQWAANDVLEEISWIDVLINNAGVVIGKYFDEHTQDEISDTLNINAEAPMHIAAQFLPFMMEHGKGHLVNISSASALLGNRKMSVYAASKWALLGWSESIRLEMEERHPEIKVTTVLPGYINTGMFQGVKSMPFVPLLEPEDVAEKIMEAIKKDISVVVEPKMVKAVPALRALLPQKAFDFLAENIFMVYKSMDKFTGHENGEK